MSDLNRGPVLLRTFLAMTRQPQAAAARAANVSDVTAHHWLKGRISPTAPHRAALAEWTNGAVPAEAWDIPALSSDVAMMEAAVERARASQPSAEAA
ncbi:MAG: hypothetical protein R3A48_28630 [Polyangiales bacterium]